MKPALPKNKLQKIYDLTASHYDVMHRYGTFGLDGRGRKFLVEHTVQQGDYILDAGGGTGTTGLMALERSGKNGQLVILDTSKKMLEKALKKAHKPSFSKKVKIQLGDMYEIPFQNNAFDVVFSSYSTCPLAEPGAAVIEMLRVLKKGGLLGIAHSTHPKGMITRKISNFIESFIWLFPRISMGCRSISLDETLDKLPIEILQDQIIGFIPWYFRLLIVRKN